MKSIFIIVFVLTSLWSFSQTESGQVIKQDSCIYVIEAMPTFSKGNVQKWISVHISYPKEAAELGVQGIVHVQFIIEKNGSVSNVKVAKSDSPLLDDEAIRVISSMPKWKPAKQKGKKVRVSYALPVKFYLPN